MREIMIIFLFIHLTVKTYVLGGQKNCVNETVSTHFLVEK